jgi:hypothetical protein
MQVSTMGVGGTISGLIKNEGVLAFWKGIPAAWGREASYASIKLGGYAPARDLIAPHMGDAPAWSIKLVAGALSGGFGSIVGNPFDVLKTLAQTNKSTTPESMGVLAGRMMKDQGISGFYRGVQANVMRACVLNASKMATYDITKGAICEKTGWGRKDLKTIFSSGLCAGVAMTIFVSPFDNIRTRLMNQPLDAKLYSGFVDCVVKTVKADGPLALYRGWIPIWARFAPTAAIQLMTIEFLYTTFGYDTI